jgi:hypothetical protein
LHAPRAIHTAAEPGRSFWAPGDRYTFLVTSDESGGSMFALDCLVGAGAARRRIDISWRTSCSLSTRERSSSRRTARPAPSRQARARTARHGAWLPQRAGVRRAHGRRVHACGDGGWFRELCPPITDGSQTPPPITDELIARMLEAGSRHHVESAI